MQGNGGVYAVKRRRKPVQKNAKPPPVKINPSKRHRDRLNVELDRLTSLLPFSEEARGRLDKLSVLRLSVGYLKVQSYFHAVLPKNTRSAPLASSNGRNGRSVSLDGVSLSEGELLLQALNGFVLVVTSDGTVFYTSSTVRDYLGFHQSDVVHQSVYDLIHVDDREMFTCQLHFALNPSDGDPGVRGEGGSQTLSPRHLPPENSSFLERNFCCRLRCLLDNTSGFMALNFSGRLKYLHLHGNGNGASAHPQLALFAIATPLQSPSVMEIRTKTFIFQSKHRMDFAPLSIDTRGKLVLGYTEMELVTPGSGYQFIHAADMLYCADNHLRMIKTGDSSFSFFRLLTKTGQWLWVQAQARIVYKGGKPDFIVARQKALTNEEGEEHLHQRRQQLPFNLTTGEGVLYDVSLDVLSIPAPGTSAAEKPLDPASILGSFQRQDHSIYTQPEKPSPPLPIFSQPLDADSDQPQHASLEQAFLDSHALLSVPGQTRTSQKRLSPTDLTSAAVMESLEQILGDIGDGGIEGLEVEDVELREWENTLLRMNKEREETSREMNHVLADDVFSYVEEALRRESGGPVLRGSEQTGCAVSGLIGGLSVQSGFSYDEPRWPPATDVFGGEVPVGHLNGVGGASRAASQRATGTESLAQQGRSSALWPPISRRHPHPGRETAPPPPWPPSSRNTSSARSIRESGLGTMELSQHCSRNHSGSQQTSGGPRSEGPSLWWRHQQQQQQQQQLSPSLHHHTLSHSSRTPGGVSSAAQPPARRLPGSCMYEKREGHIPSAGPVLSRQNGPLPGPTCVGGATHVAGTTTDTAAFPLSHTGLHQGATPAPSAGVGHPSGSDMNGGTRGAERRAENGAVKSPFYYWNSEVQIPKVPVNGAVDPFTSPVRPAGGINLSQNTAP